VREGEGYRREMGRVGVDVSQTEQARNVMVKTRRDGAEHCKAVGMKGVVEMRERSEQETYLRLDVALSLEKFAERGWKSCGGVR
jgi:hypothetical protein